MDIWRIILVSHKSHTIIRMTYFSREAYLNIKYLPCIKALLRELSFPVSLNIISVCNILISTLTYLQKDGCNQAITRLLNYEHVKVRQLSAHYTTRSGAYISSKTRLTQSLEYLRRSNKLLSKIIHHLDISNDQSVDSFKNHNRSCSESSNVKNWRYDNSMHTHYIAMTFYIPS